MRAAKLYTPEVLALATSLAGFPPVEGMPLQGAARSKSCGSTISLGLSLDAAGRIERIGLRTQACAVGQAAAAIFAAAAVGRDRADIEGSHDALAAWLAGSGAMPDWPSLDLIAGTREFPARHGAVMLAWKAALDVLPMDDGSR